MRKIAFRAWDKELKEMEYFDLHHLIGQQQRKEIMQFTGLLDKNGKEIYEGDIVTLKYLNDTGKTAMVVEWANENFGWYFTRGKNSKFSLAIGSLQENTEIKVVSNIYNPDLLPKV